jgi:hypothetical protein
LDSDSRELTLLEGVAGDYRSDEGFSKVLCESGAYLVLEHGDEGPTLEVGCANCTMTDIFMANLPDVEVVEPTHIYAQEYRNRYGTIGLHQTLFEDFETDKRYQNIVLAGLLEHVRNPQSILLKARSLLQYGGYIHVLVPNRASVHRQLGATLGLIETTSSLSEADHQMGHRRTYYEGNLISEVKLAGFWPSRIVGNYIKPVPNSTMERYPAQFLEILRCEGRKYPEIAAEIYLVAGVRGD